MAYSYFVYYRVAAERAADCESAVLALFSALKQSTNIAGRLLKKRSEPLLWMEVYENVRDDANFELQLAQGVESLGLEAKLEEGSKRQIECFEA